MLQLQRSLFTALFNVAAGVNHLHYRAFTPGYSAPRQLRHQLSGGPLKSSDEMENAGWKARVLTEQVV